MAIPTSKEWIEPCAVVLMAHSIFLQAQQVLSDCWQEGRNAGLKSGFDMRNILSILLTALLLLLWSCMPKSDGHSSHHEPIYFPDDLFGISLGISYDSVNRILHTNNLDGSVVSDFGSGLTIKVSSQVPYQNTFFEQAYVFICQKHGVIEIVGVKQFDDYESAERCYNVFSDTITALYGNYHSDDSLSEGIVKQSIFRENNKKLSLDIQESKRIIDIWPLIEANSWNINISLSNEVCKDI